MIYYFSRISKWEKIVVIDFERGGKIRYSIVRRRHVLTSHWTTEEAFHATYRMITAEDVEARHDEVRDQIKQVETQACPIGHPAMEPA